MDPLGFQWDYKYRYNALRYGLLIKVIYIYACDEMNCMTL